MHLSRPTRIIHSSTNCISTSLWPSQQSCLLQPPLLRTLLFRSFTSRTCASNHAASRSTVERSTSEPSRGQTQTAGAARPPTSHSHTAVQGETHNIPTLSHGDPKEQQEQDSTAAGQTNRSTAEESSGSRSTTGRPFSIDDPQLLVGDCVALVAAALYR